MSAAKLQNWATAVRLKIPTQRKNGIPSGAHFYFVHSYYPTTADASWRSATCTYGMTFPAAVGRGPLFATQFHPEKSQRVGLEMLRRFAEWR